MRKVCGRVVAAVLAAGAMGVVGCGGEGSSDARWTGTVDTLADGGVRVSSPAEGIWEEGEVWRLVEDLRIGSLDGDGPEVFGNIQDVAVDDQGRMYVLDAQAHEIRVFGPDGAWIRTLGGQGAGPGELNVPFAGEVLIGRDGRVWVNNSFNRRWELFSAEGEHRGSTPQRSTFIGASSVMGVDGAIRQRARMRIDGEEPRDVVVRLEPMGDSLAAPDTLVAPDIREQDVVTLSTTNAGNTVSFALPVPFVHQPGWSFDPAGHFWVEPGDGYRLVALDTSHDTLRIVERAYEPVPVTAADLEEALERFQTGPLANADGDLDRSRIPEHHPPIDRYLTDDTGHLWVRRRIGEGLWAWDVFAPDGPYLGAVRTEIDLDRLTVHAIRDGRVYGVVLDDLDVPWVVRLRVEQAGGGA